MKPLGLRPVRFPGKRDVHPDRKHGWMNWWEVEFAGVGGKSVERRRVQDEIDEQLEDSDFDKVSVAESEKE